MRNRKLSILMMAVCIFFGGMLFMENSTAQAATTGQDIADEAHKYLGNPVENFDQGHGVRYTYTQFGITLPSSLSALSKEGTFIPKGSTLKPGDILFFGNSTTDLLAAGIYTGNNEFITAYKPFRTVRKMNLDSSEPQKYYLGAKRIIGSESRAKSHTASSNLGQKVIDAGLEYLGTTYEFNSNRSSTTTMDCSDFVRRAYHDVTGQYLPGNSRKQASYVKNNGTTTTNWRNLNPGDLMFFTSPSTGNIFHVSLYMGDGKMLHTYSVSSGGVRIDKISSYWDGIFTFGGSILD